MTAQTPSSSTCTIRLLDHRDASSIQELAADQSIAATTNVPHPYPSNGGKEFIRHAHQCYGAQTAMPFAIQAHDRLVGIITINAIQATPAIDYWIGRPYWGQGHATRAISLAVTYAAQQLDIDQIISKALTDNTASHHVLLKNGFAPCGEEPYAGPKQELQGTRLRCFQWLKSG